MTFCSIIPDYILKKIGDKRSLKLTKKLRALRNERLDVVNLPQPSPHVEIRALYDAKNKLEGGDLLQFDRQEHGSTAEGSTPELQMFNIAYDFIHEQMKRESYDNKNASMKIYKHVGVDYNNAFWDGERFAFGDCDQEYFKTFWIQNVASHEAMHAVTEWVAGLIYIGQSGALDEHISDVFAVCVDQFKAKQKPSDASWLIGDGVFMGSVNAKGLRTFKNELAYDDPWIGKDPQGKHMKDYYTGTKDNYGVHINSGIPNHAFYQFCTITGLDSWIIPFSIWFAALQLCNPSEEFNTFAQKTLYVCPEQLRQALSEAWYRVGIEPAPKPTPESIWTKILRFLVRLFLWWKP